MVDYLLLTEEQSVSAAPIPMLTGSGPAELGLHSIRGYGYASH